MMTILFDNCDHLDNLTFFFKKMVIEATETAMLTSKTGHIHWTGEFRNSQGIGGPFIGDKHDDLPIANSSYIYIK